MYIIKVVCLNLIYINRTLLHCRLINDKITNIHKIKEDFFIMKIKSKYLLGKLVSLGIYQTEILSNNKNNIDNDNIITDAVGNDLRVITENVSDDEVYTALEVEKIETLHSIKSMLKFFVVLTIVGLFIFLLTFVDGLSGV